MPTIGSNSKPAYVYDSGTDTWIPIGPGEHTHDYIGKDVITTTGDIIYASAANTPARRGIGSTGQVLTVSGGVPTWATPAAGGKVLQVVSATSASQTSASSSTYVDYISTSITPSATTSKILIFASVYRKVTGDNTGSQGATFRFVRGSTTLFSNFYYMYDLGDQTSDARDTWNQHYLDSPSTTSSTTYKIQFNSYNGTVTCGDSGAYMSNLTLMEIGA